MTAARHQASDNQKLSSTPFRFFVKEHRRAFILGVMALVFTNVLDVLTPVGLKMAIDAISGKDSTGLIYGIGAYTALMTGVTVFRYLWRIHFGRFHHAVANDLRHRIFTKMVTFGPSYYQKNPVGQLMSLLTNDVNSFRMAIGPGVLILLDAALLIVMIVPIMIYLSWDWTWKTLILLPALPFFMRHMEVLIHQRFRAQQDRLSEVSGHAQEIISGVRVIKGFHQEKNRSQMFNSRSREYQKACDRVAKVDSAFHPTMEFAVACGSVILLWWCSPEVTRGNITLGTFVAFHEYIKKLIWPMSAIGIGSSMLEQGKASFDRIRDLLMTDTDIPDIGQRTIKGFESLVIDGLTFRYPDSTVDVLKDVSLTVRAGETVGVVGPVGAGKTTLMHLISRLHPAASGSIRINGVALEDISHHSLCQLISYVTQEAFLFSDTIAENLAFGLREAPDMETIESAAALVNIDREIRHFPSGYHAPLGERGVNLSGGQKQRLTIARAVIRRSPVVILDDSLSAVDGSTEKRIVSELRKSHLENQDQTVFIVSHRLATLKHADKIVVLNHGVIEAIGTHQELLVKSSTYHALNLLQAALPSESSLNPPFAGGAG